MCRAPFSVLSPSDTSVYTELASVPGRIKQCINGSALGSLRAEVAERGT